MLIKFGIYSRKQACHLVPRLALRLATGLLTCQVLADQASTLGEVAWYIGEGKPDPRLRLRFWRLGKGGGTRTVGLPAGSSWSEEACAVEEHRDRCASQVR